MSHAFAHSFALVTIPPMFSIKLAMMHLWLLGYVLLLSVYANGVRIFETVADFHFLILSATLLGGHFLGTFLSLSDLTDQAR